MTRRIHRTLLLALLAVVGGAFASPGASQGRTASIAPPRDAEGGLLAAGTPAETPWRVVDSGKSGPTVVVIGGVHGDEPAGARAARQIASWPIASGRLVVVERANVLALAAGARQIPGAPKGERDLNRQFPPRDGASPLVRDLWSLLGAVEPDVVVDLHEGFDFTRTNPRSVGSSVIASSGARGHADAMVAAIDATITDPDRRFVVKGPPIRGSLARAAADELGVPSFIVETTKRAQSLAFRVRQHRILVRALLERVGMLEPGVDCIVGPNAPPDLARVALYVSTGVGGRGPARLERLLTPEYGFLLRRVCATDIRAGALGEFEAVIFPGGSGSGQAEALRPEGRGAIVEFVRDGGGYVGFCAGAYLAASNYDWSLGLLDADVIDRAHWRRGRAPLPLDWTEEGRSLASDGDRAALEREVLYANGPILRRSGRDDVPDFEVLATFAGEVAENGAPRGVMPGTPAIVRGEFGAGRVVCSSPHPEQSDGLERLTRRLVASALDEGHAAGR